jgi:hypothetical protein
MGTTDAHVNGMTSKNPPLRQKLEPGEKFHIDLAEILRQGAIPRFEELACYLYPGGHKKAQQWLVGNANGDPGKSFSINLRTTVFGDFADGEKMQSGAVNLWMTARNVDFVTACKQLKDWLGLACPESIAMMPKKPIPFFSKSSKVPQPLSPLELLRMHKASVALAEHPELIYSVVGQRPEWTRETVRGAALDGDLGFELNCVWYDFEGPAVLFGYNFGVKARWLLSGRRVVRWVCGGPTDLCWRQSHLRKDHQRIYITEGETDALTGISIGLEDDTVPSLVIGLASASQTPKAEAFTDKEVVIVSDPDGAGAKATRKLLNLCGRFARKVVAMQPETQLEDNCG